MPEPFVSCRRLSKLYSTPSGAIEALHEIDATFELGEVTAVVGASGSGKSTLLRAIAALDRPSSGELTVGPNDLCRVSPAELRRHRRDVVTYVSQKAADNFVPHLSIAQQPGATGEAVAGLLEAFGVSERADSRPAELSGGEQARAAFALALARGTPLVIADEPTAELDRDSAGRLLLAIRARAGAGVGFVLATHDRDVLEAADRVLRLERGRVSTAQAPSQRTPLPAAQRPEAPAVVQVSGLRKSFRRRGETITALRSASIDLRAGELGVLLGRSGSGKSTLLAILGGWQTPDGGEISYGSNSSSSMRFAWEALAVLPQRFGLLPELTVRENVEHPLRLAGRLGREHDRAGALLAALGLDELADRFPQETSIGQQQRTALARALVLRPRVLLADEPTSHQDAAWREAVWQLLRDAASEGSACLVATHEEEIAAYATRVWTIDQGATEAWGS